MDRRTILKATNCDLTRLPLGARAAFVLSQLDGQLTLQDLAEVVGIELDELLELARVLSDHGAVAEVAARPAPTRTTGKNRPLTESVASPKRADPRAESPSIPPASKLRERPAPSVRPPQPERQATRNAQGPKRHPTPRPERRRSRKSVGAQRAVVPPVIVAPGAGVARVVPTEVPPTQKSAESPAATPKAPPQRRASTRMKPASRRMQAVGAPPAPAAAVAAPETNPATQTTGVIAKSPAITMVSAVSSPAEGAPAPTLAERVEAFRAGAREVKTQQAVDLLVKAAEDALRANDVVVAANNYRLALSHRDDPHLRMKFEEVEARAKVVRFEKNIGPARAAEKDKRWEDAAVFFERAHDARPDPDVAAATANALRLSGGDLRKATTLAEQAVARDDKNVGHWIVLAEVHLAANRPESAEQASAQAAALAPKDARIRDLSAAIAASAASAASAKRGIKAKA